MLSGTFVLDYVLVERGWGILLIDLLCRCRQVDYLRGEAKLTARKSVKKHSSASNVGWGTTHLSGNDVAFPVIPFRYALPLDDLTKILHHLVGRDMPRLLQGSEEFETRLRGSPRHY